MRCERSNIPLADDALVKKRQEELKHAQDVRELYERKMERANNVFLELSAVMLQLEQREQEISRREFDLKTGRRSVKKAKPVLTKSGRIQKKYSITSQGSLRHHEMNPELLSSSPDSPPVYTAAP